MAPVPAHTPGGAAQTRSGSHRLLWRRSPPRAPGLKEDGDSSRPPAVKEISALELLVRFFARFAAASGVIALLIWLTWVMLDVKNLQSGFTLP